MKHRETKYHNFQNYETEKCPKLTEASRCMKYFTIKCPAEMLKSFKTLKH